MKTWLFRVAVGAVLAAVGGMALVFLALLGIVFPLEFVFTMVTGWLTFLFRVVPQVEVDVAAAVLGCSAFGIFVVGLHVLLRHLAASYRQDDAAAIDLTINWRLRWTISAASIILLIFIAGIAFVGITHQTIWLLTSPEPIMQRPGRLISPESLRVVSAPTGGDANPQD
jgi:hypothetical protein